MVFSSVLFLFLFFPLVLLGYYLIDRRYKNIFLLIISLAFYAYGEPKFVFIMIGSILLNHFLALGIDRLLKKEENRGDISYRKKAKVLLILSIAFNVSVFFIFKYLNFTIDNANGLLGLFGVQLPQTEILLPIGISFFTFQMMSYVFDVYLRQGTVQKNPINTALYISLFPQLIAGPIVRYQTVADEINERKETAADFSRGVTRFVIGLSKKVLLSNQLALAADYAFDACAAGTMTTSLGWLGAIAYTLQILFDFSGYSDMAIGLGLMFGFHFNENFRTPYMSATVSEFWRRWHISLGSWFRDYVYIPLGGSRVSGKGRLIFNLLIVWGLTGIWHGAEWTFILWGLMYFVLLTAEKLLDIPKKLQKMPLSVRVGYRIFTLLSVMFGWVLFRAEDLGQAGAYLKSMFGFAAQGMSNSTSQWMWQQFAVLLIIAAIACVDWKHVFRRDEKEVSFAGKVLGMILLPILLILCISIIVNSSYDPFIYFNF